MKVLGDEPSLREPVGFDWKSLSLKARGLAGIWFGNMRVGSGNSGLTLHLRESQPAAETRAALDELVERGVISKTPLNQYGGEVYRPLVDCWPAFEWVTKNSKRPELSFRLMEPISQDNRKDGWS